MSLDMRGGGRSGVCEWAEIVRLPGAVFCGSLRHPSLSQGGNDPGHSSHTGFKFLFFNKKKKRWRLIWWSCVSSQSLASLRAAAAAAGCLNSFVCLKHCGGNVQAADLGRVCAHVWVHVSSPWHLHLLAFSAACAFAILLISFVGDTSLLSWGLDHPDVTQWYAERRPQVWKVVESSQRY